MGQRAAPVQDRWSPRQALGTDAAPCRCRGFIKILEKGWLVPAEPKRQTVGDEIKMGKLLAVWLRLLKLGAEGTVNRSEAGLYTLRRLSQV